MIERNKYQKKVSGFTLIELMVVIAIIGLLASVILVSLSTARAKARDAKRLADMKQLQTALALYLENNGVYPNSDSEGCGGYETPGDGDFISALRTSGFLAVDVKDPKADDNCGNYRYYRYPAGYQNCDTDRGGFYVLEIMVMESGSNPNPGSKGWTCPLRSWSGDGYWVTGAFEK